MPISFYILALFTLLSAVCAMSLRNLVHCALSLALAFLGVAALFLRMNAGFVAFAQILVYVGAVAILIVFAILLTRNSEQNERYSLRNVVIAVPLAATLGALMVNAVFRTNLAVSAQSAAAPSPQEIGTSLMTTHLIPLELLGVLLTVALLGAVVLALPERGDTNSGAPPA